MSQYRVLVVDDDDDLRDLLFMTLRQRYEVVLAVDGLDALTHLSAYEPDLAICDVEMPLLGGFELCEAVRQHPDFQTMPVLFLSGHGDIDQIKKGYKVGANLFMVKPLDAARIMQNLEMTIAQSKVRVRPKTHTIQQIQAMESAGTLPTTVPGRSARIEADDAAPAGASHPPPAPEAEEEELKAIPRILVVDDDDDMRQLIELSLKGEFEVAHASDGLEAVKRIVACQPDLITLDIMMPGMNGYHLLESIRRNPSHRNLPVIIVSAKSSQRDRDHAAQIGATDFLGKPFMPDELLAKIRSMTRASGFQIRHKDLTIAELADLEFLEKNGRQEFAVLRGIKKRTYQSPQQIMAEQARKNKLRGM